MDCDSIDLDLLSRLVTSIYRKFFKPVQRIHAIDYVPKNSVLAIEVCMSFVGKEELTP